MIFFTNLWRTVRPTVRRFPGTFVLGALVAVFTSLSWIVSTNSGSPVWTSAVFALAKSASWAWALSIAAQLFLERALARLSARKRTIAFFSAQAVSVLVAFVPGRFWCDHSSARFYLVYFCTFFALLLLSCWLLHDTQRFSLVVPNIVMSIMIAGIISGCISAGGSVVAFAIQKLIFDFESHAEYVYPIIWIAAWTFFFSAVFVSYVSKKTEAISTPKAFKVIVLYVLFTLYVMLVAVLYVYLLKSFAMRTLPSGMINPFVSSATVLYLFFHLSLREYKSRPVAFFYRFGAVFMLVLIGAQLVAFAIRVGAYGFTEARVASAYYIAFSLVFCVLPLVKGGALMKHVYIVFAAICLIAGLSPLNLLDAPVKSQSARIVRIMKKHNLHQNGQIVAAGGQNELSRGEKAAIVNAWEFISHADGKKPKWFASAVSEESGRGAHFDEFKSLFGFSFSHEYEHDESEDGREKSVFYTYLVDAVSDDGIDVSGFSKLYAFSNYTQYDKSEEEKNLPTKAIVAYGNGRTIDITDDVVPLMHISKQKSRYSALEPDSTAPLVIKKGDCAVVLRRLQLIREEEEGKDIFRSVDMSGYVLQ